MPAKFIINVSETDFEYEVLKFSLNTPVVVDFWATWCRPCKVLDPMLERLALEANGSIRLARVDVDENPNLVLKYSVRTIPTVKAISQGEVVSEFVDVVPENRLREFFANIARPSPMNLAVEKAASILANHQWAEAEKLFKHVLESNPEYPEVLLGVVKALLGQGKGTEAIRILRNFPPSRQYSQAESLIPLTEALLALQQELLPTATDLDAIYINSIRLASKGNIPAAIDGLFDILRADRNFQNGKAHQVVLSLLQVLGNDDPLTRSYRSELATILF
jgi:putative thioredoxin